MTDLMKVVSIARAKEAAAAKAVTEMSSHLKYALFMQTNVAVPYATTTLLDASMRKLTDERYNAVLSELEAVRREVHRRCDCVTEI